MRNDNNISGAKRLFTDFVMGVVFLLLLAFALWIIWVYMFRGAFDTEALLSKEKTVLEEIAARESGVTYEHFHNVDEAVLAGAESASLCLRCHGNYPHSKAPDIRAFLNAHAFFVACEVCHIRAEEEERIDYKWLENGTGTPLTKLEGKAGSYGGMIVPLKTENGKVSRLDESADRDFIEEYLKLSSYFNADQQAEAKVRIHKDISSKPIFCDECHVKDGLFDFTQLLYSKEIAHRLESGEAATMVAKYNKFYLPTMFDPTATFRERKRLEEEEQKAKEQ